MGDLVLVVPGSQRGSDLLNFPCPGAIAFVVLSAAMRSGRRRGLRWEFAEVPLRFEVG
jgi:hypothetical protein